MPDITAIQTWQPHVEQRFRIVLDEGREIEILLKEVKALPDQVRPMGDSSVPRRVPFSLLFEVSGDLHLPQSTYSLDHPDLGDLGPVFLVPIGRDGEGLYCEAIFN